MAVCDAINFSLVFPEKKNTHKNSTNKKCIFGCFFITQWLDDIACTVENAMKNSAAVARALESSQANEFLFNFPLYTHRHQLNAREIAKRVENDVWYDNSLRNRSSSMADFFSCESGAGGSCFY
jgi:hypothetical protein